MRKHGSQIFSSPQPINNETSVLFFFNVTDYSNFCFILLFQTVSKLRMKAIKTQIALKQFDYACNVFSYYFPLYLIFFKASFIIYEFL